jgi:hypothetical protein
MTDATHKSSSDIEREVEDTRSGLERTLGELRDRVQPRAVVDEIWDFASGSGGGDFARNLGRAVKDNPVPVVLIGAGIAWLMSGKGTPSFGSRSSRGYFSDDYHHYDEDAADYSFQPYQGGRRRLTAASSSYADEARDPSYSTPYTRSDFRREGYERMRSEEPGMIDKAKDGIRNAGDAISDAASRAAGAVTGAAHSVADSVSGAASSVADRVSGAGHQVSGSASRFSDQASGYGDRAAEQAGYLRERASRFGSDTYRRGASAGRSVSHFAEEQPLLVAALGLAVGAVIGASFRSTQAERRWMGEHADRVRSTAADYAHEGYERAAEALSHTYEEVKKEAQDQGLTTSDAKSAVGSLGDRVRAVYEKGKDTLADEVRANEADAEKKADEASDKLAEGIKQPGSQQGGSTTPSATGTIGTSGGGTTSATGSLGDRPGSNI